MRLSDAAKGSMLEDEVEVPHDEVVRLRAGARGTTKHLQFPDPAGGANVILMDVVHPQVARRTRSSEGCNPANPPHGHQLHRLEDGQ